MLIKKVFAPLLADPILPHFTVGPHELNRKDEERIKKHPRHPHGKEEDEREDGCPVVCILQVVLFKGSVVCNSALVIHEYIYFYQIGIVSNMKEKEERE